MKQTHLEQKVERVEGRLKGIEIRLWELENTPLYKYGDKFGEIKVLERSISENMYGRVYSYTFDDGKGLSIMWENDLTRLIEKNKTKLIT